MKIEAIRGGRNGWAIVGDFISETLQLVEITGISIQADLDPGWQSATVAVKVLDPAGTIDGTSEAGQRVQILFNRAEIWAGDVQNIQKDKEQVTLTLTGDLSRLDPNYTRYSVLADSPRGAAEDWIAGAAGVAVDAGGYTDNHYRDRARVAPAACTLGEWPEPLSYDRPHLTGYRAQADGQGNYQPLAVDMGTPDPGPWITVSNFSPCPDGQAPSATGSRTNPILFHRQGGKIRLTAEAGATDNPGWGGKTAPASCDWMAGRDQYFKVTGGLIPGVSGANWEIEGVGVTPSGAKTARVRTAGLAEIIGQSIALSLTGIGWHKIPGYSKTVSQGVYESSRITAAAQCWAKWKGGAAPGWVSSDKIQDQIDFSDGLAGRAIAKNNNAYGATFSAIYKHPNSQPWTGAALSGDCVYYAFTQDLTPVTIQQEVWTESQALEACFLAGVCAAEQPGRWPLSLVDLLPESGTIYPIPLDNSTAADLAYAEDRPLPGVLHCSYRDFLGNDNKITTNAFNPGNTSEKDLTILQGSILKSDRLSWQSVEGDLNDFAVAHYQRTGTSWDYGPGALADRYSNITYNVSRGAIQAPDIASDWQHQEYDEQGGIIYPDSAFSLYGFCFLGEQGQIVPAARPAHWSGSTGDLGPDLPGYTVRDKQGREYQLFSQYVDLTLYGATGAGLDFFPAESMRRASERVYSLKNRPIYTLKASFAFASAKVGAVVLLRCTAWHDGQPWLALILGKTLSTDSAGVDLRIAPMHAVTDSDRESWAGLADLMDRVVYEDIIWQPEPSQSVLTLEFGQQWTYAGLATSTYSTSQIKTFSDDEYRRFIAWREAAAEDYAAYQYGVLNVINTAGETLKLKVSSATNNYILFTPVTGSNIPEITGFRVYGSANYRTYYSYCLITAGYRGTSWPNSGAFFSKVFSADYAILPGARIWLEITEDY